MILGTCRIDLHIPAAGSLKGKRAVIKSLKERIRNRMNVSVAEVDHQDFWQRAALGVAVVSNEKKHADQVLAAVVRLVRSEPRVEIIDIRVEFL
ncbi:MAG: DUF503 domain-containing protein [Candidatus Eisenbacteria bacterium]|nr:DUF503 domain-containing protein [Candidatus Eisenbacteria bacterium]